MRSDARENDEGLALEEGPDEDQGVDIGPVLARQMLDRFHGGRGLGALMDDALMDYYEAGQYHGFSDYVGLDALKNP